MGLLIKNWPMLMGFSELYCLPALQGHYAQKLEPPNTDEATVALWEVDRDPSEVSWDTLEKGGHHLQTGPLGTTKSLPGKHSKGQNNLGQTETTIETKFLPT